MTPRPHRTEATNLERDRERVNAAAVVVAFFLLVVITSVAGWVAGVLMAAALSVLYIFGRNTYPWGDR